MSANRKILSIEELEWSADALERLSELRGARDLIDRLTERAVVECRGNAQQEHVDDTPDGTRRATTVAPIPWSRIANELGVSRQTAWQRFRHVE